MVLILIASLSFFSSCYLPSALFWHFLMRCYVQCLPHVQQLSCCCPFFLQPVGDPLAFHLRSLRFPQCSCLHTHRDLVNDSSHLVLGQPEEETDKQHRILCLTYIKGISETLHRTYRPLIVRIVHKAPNTLHSLLTRFKPSTPKDQVTGVIYQIPCECGDNYIGETSKTLNERLKEHQQEEWKTTTQLLYMSETLNTTSHGKMPK